MPENFGADNESDEETEKLMMAMDDDIAISEEISHELIPRALYYYLDLVGEEGSEDSDEDEDEAAGKDSDKDEDDDDDKKKKKGGKKSKDEEGGKGEPASKKECKQQ